MAIFTVAAGLLGAAGFTGAITIAGLSPALSAVIVGGVRSLAFSGIQAALQKSASIPLQETQANISQARSARRIAYGLNRLGGVRTFFEAKSSILHMLIVHCEGESSSLQNFVVGGDATAVDANGLALNSALEGYVHLEWRNGTSADFAELRNAFPDMWTTEHELRGSTVTYARFKRPPDASFSKVFPSAENTSVQGDIRGREVDDPRNATTAYSDNASLCISDYLTSTDGVNINTSRVDYDSFAAFADICDEAVGSSSKRYRLAGVASMDDEFRNVIAEMSKAADCTVYTTIEGKVGILGGKYSTPDVTITSSDIFSIEWETGKNPLTDFNILKGVYTSPEHDFKPQEAPERRDETSLATQAERLKVLDVPWCPDGHQMQRLMKSHEARERPEKVATLTTNLVGIKARFPKGDGIHTVRIESQNLNGVFEVKSHSYSIPDKTCTIQLASIYDAWAWSEAEEEELAPPLATLSQNGTVKAIPENLILSQELVEISADSSGAQIVARVDNPARDDLQLIAEYKLDEPEAEWVAMTVGVNGYRATSGIVSEGEYDVHAYWLGQGVAVADYPEESITVLSNPSIPPIPTNESISESVGDVTISWTNAASDFYRTRVFHNTSNSFSGASFVADVSGVTGQASQEQQSPGSGTHYYWIVTLNASLVSSAPVSLPSVTVI